MFKGLLNRVAVDLVCNCLKFDIRKSVNRQRRLIGVAGQVSAPR